MTLRLKSQTFVDGDESLPYRVWIADDVGLMRLYYVESPDVAADVIRAEGDGAMAAGLETLEDGDWSEWSNDDGYDVTEVYGL